MVDGFLVFNPSMMYILWKGGWLAQHAFTYQMGVDITLRDNNDLPARCGPEIFTGVASLFGAQYKLLAGQRRIPEPFASVAPRLHPAALACIWRLAPLPR